MELRLGDNKEILQQYPDNYFTACLTDPPYGYKFMNHRWDYDVPSTEQWELVLRKLKPGATLLAFAGARTQHRMAVNIEDAGFLLKDTIMWVYGSGFPKAADISKMIDKRAGAEREVVGKRKHPTLKDTNKLEEQANAAHGDNAWAREWDITAPSTEDAVLWNGYKSHALKPAYEPIIMAIKPNDGTYVDNALKHGVAGINIDACRVGTDDILSFGSRELGDGIKYGKCKPTTEGIQHPQGRFPANFIHDGSDEVVSLFPKTKSGKMLPTHTRTAEQTQNAYGKFKNKDWKLAETYGDQGSAARFFYCPKVSKEERNAGCESLSGENVEHGRFDICAKCGKYILQNQARKSACKCENPVRKGLKTGGNSHPTVKPIALIEYLLKFVIMPGNNMLVDPWAGTGSTGCGCLINNIEDFVLIEQKRKYYEIQEARIAYWSAQQRKLL